MGSVDLDALKAARAETLGEGHVVRWGGEEFTLPSELPFDFVFHLAEGDLKAAAIVIFDGQADRFWAHRPSSHDLRDLFRAVPKLYGMNVGESPASGGSSSSAGSPSRPTSPATTEPTSGQPSSAPAASGSDGSEP